MTGSNELNDLFNTGKDEIKQAVRAYLHRSQGQGAGGERRIAMAVSSQLSLSLRKVPPQIDISHIRLLIIEENAEILAGMDNEPNLVRLFAVATGRATEIREYLAALDRIAQTCTEGGEGLAAYLVAMKGWLSRMERMSVRIIRGADGVPALLESADSGILPPASRILEEELV